MQHTVCRILWHFLPKGQWELSDLIVSLLVSSVQDPNWYKARREDGLEGMVPANFLQEAQPMPRAKVNLHKME